MADENDQIDITGIDKVELLQALYRNTRAVGMGMLHDQRGGLTKEQAREVLASTRRNHRGELRFDYVFGRPLKLAMTETALTRVWLYDRDAGPGACQRAVDEARAASAAQPRVEVSGG